MDGEAGAAAPFEGLLAEAGRLLASSLNVEETLRTVARLAVPEVADWAVVDVVEPGGAVRQVSSGHPDPAVDALLVELRRRHRARRRGRRPFGALEVIETGVPAILPAAEPPGGVVLTAPEEAALWRRIVAASWLAVPLRIGDRILGAITFLSTDAERIYDERDLPVALELADRCAQALRNAQVHEEAQSARALLDTVFATAQVGLALIDCELRFVLVNEWLADLNGVPVEQHLGRRIMDALGRDAADVDALVRQVVESGRPVQDAHFAVGDRMFLASYTPVEVEGHVLGVVAAVVETTERHRIQAAIAQSEARYRALLDSGMIGIVRGRWEQIVEANETFLTMLGYTRADVEGGRLSWPRITPRRWAAVDAGKWLELVRTGRLPAFEKEYLHKDGTRVPVLVGAAFHGGDAGEWTAFVVDLTERKAAERLRERLLDRTARLQAVTERLSAALTRDDVATVILAEGMAALGATCGVLGLTGEDGALRLDHRQGMAGEVPATLPRDAGAPMPAAARSGAPVLMRSRADWLDRFPAVPPRGDFEAFAAVPLLFEGGVAGVMGLGFPDRRTLEAGDVEMLMAIGRQGAQALERAHLYEERAYVARTLQEGLLPRSLPWIQGLDVAARYRPVADGSEVGGDFYDVVTLDDDGWLVVVGDSCGKGTAAAVQTGVMRSTVRALALFEHRPEGLLQGVNEALLREPAPDALATMACAAVRRDADGFAVRLVAAGHPPALVLRAGGAVEQLDATGVLLGLTSDLDLEIVDTRLADGDLLLLYTDGIIDARRGASGPFGEARLRAALASAAGRDAAGALAVIDAAVRRFAPGPPRDDKALLAVRAAL